MIILYKYLFYSVSYLVKKYDRFWDVGETYYVGGAMFVGMTIATILLNLFRIIGLLYCRELLDCHCIYRYVPLVLGLSVTIYLGVTKKHLKIYDEVANMDKRRKKKYKALNIIHLIFAYGGMLLISEIIRSILVG